MTGYLTQKGEEHDQETDILTTELVIPNREIRWIFMQQIWDWFEEETAASYKYGIACYKKRCRVISERSILTV